jgi:hypothetical protein
MLFDPLNFSNNSLIGFHLEYINSCKAETVVAVPVANGLGNTAADLLKQCFINFLLAIRFSADSIDMEGITRASNDVTRIANEIERITPFHTAPVLGNSSNCINILALRSIVFSSACNSNLIMIAYNHPYKVQYYTTNNASQI